MANYKGKAAVEGEGEDEDKISSLPVCLLSQILSDLGDTKEAVRTCVLSKTWELVWTHLLEVNLKASMFADDLEPVRIVEYADWMISKCNSLNKFGIDFHYDRAYASAVNNLINKIVNKNKVKDITLSFEIDDNENIYRLPQVLFSYSSLSKLTLKFCVMDPPQGIIEWNFLECLKIKGVDLSNSIMENILFHSPLLKILDIYNCWGLSNLNIISQNLTTLYYNSEYEDDDMDSPDLVVSAPYLRVLSISREPGGRKYKLQNVSSVVEATIEFNRSSSSNWSSSDESTISNMVNFFQGLRSVEILELGSIALEIVSEWELSLLRFPSFTELWSLTLKVDRDITHIPGILGMLRISPKLRTLYIEGSDDQMIKNDEYKPLTKLYMGKDEHLYKDFFVYPVKSHVKTVEFDKNIEVEHMLHLVQILLKSTIDLEKMVINLDASLDSTEIAKRLDIIKRDLPKAAKAVAAKAVLELRY